MEPNKKLEKQFKTQLQSREIQPTPAAWDRLDAMLTVAEEKKAGFNYQWLYIAAALIGFIAIAYVFLSHPASAVDAPRNEVVEQNQPAIQKNQDSIEKANQLQDKVEVVPAAFQNKQQTVAENQPKPRKSTSILQKTIPQPVTTSEKSIAQESSINHQKTEQINPTSPVKSTVNPETALAQTEIKLGTSAIKVNASNLLSKVDGELNLTFREKVIKSINQNYQNVKVALANRNQETNINQ